MTTEPDGQGKEHGRDARYASADLDRLEARLKSALAGSSTLVILAGAGAGAGAGTDRAAATADAIAKRLQRSLVRVDLSHVVSKWLGETEKNLSRVFAEASRSDSVLLFDEADALFGKRGDVQSAGDRYDSAATNYLLQQIDAFSGVVLAVVTDPEPAKERTKKLRRAATVVVVDP